MSDSIQCGEARGGGGGSAGARDEGRRRAARDESWRRGSTHKRGASSGSGSGRANGREGKAGEANREKMGGRDGGWAAQAGGAATCAPSQRALSAARAAHDCGGTLPGSLRGGGRRCGSPRSTRPPGRRLQLRRPHAVGSRGAGPHASSSSPASCLKPVRWSRLFCPIMCSIVGVSTTSPSCTTGSGGQGAQDAGVGDGIRAGRQAGQHKQGDGAGLHVAADSVPSSSRLP